MTSPVETALMHRFRKPGSFVARLLRRGFLHGFAIPFLGLTSVHRLWFTSRSSSLDEVLFSDSWGLPHRLRPEIHPWLAIALALALVHLAWLAMGSWFDKKRPKLDLFLAGVACAVAVYGGTMQLGASFVESRRLDPPIHYAVLDAIRWIGFWGTATAILVSALRSVGAAKAVLGRVAAVSAIGIVLSGFVLGWTGAKMAESWDWWDARSIGTTLSMDAFVKAHPGSRHVQEARRLAWAKVAARPDLARIRFYLEHARDWGDRIDSAKILEDRTIRSMRRRAAGTLFSRDPRIDEFWRSRIPGSDALGLGTRIVRYRVVLERFDPLREARTSVRAGGRRVFVPDSVFDPYETPGRNRLAEDLLDSAVRNWAGPALLTIAPWREGDSTAPDVVVRLRAGFRGPLELVPCAPGCPPDSERWALPELAYSWSVELAGPPEKPCRASGEVADTTAIATREEGEAIASEGAWPKEMDLEQAWNLRRERSLRLLAGSLRKAWKTVR